MWMRWLFIHGGRPMICCAYLLQAKDLEHLLREMVLKINRLEDNVAELME
tara:strand:- start:39 stop:188 length:150 start_codon:yes stop_codon:yes gene_type:complete